MLKLPRVIVGTMNFGARTPEAEARRVVDCALERGFTAFDTANLYSDGASERVLGAALGARRDRATLITKVGLLRRGGKPEGLAPERLTAAVHESLTRLATDRIDVLLLHAPDPLTPLARTLDAVQGLLTKGAIGAWGVSNFAAWQVLELNHLCASRGMPRPALSQVLYNVLIRQLDVEYFAFAAAHPIHTTVYNPLAGGLLARDPRSGSSAPPGSRLASNALYRRRYGSEALRSLAARFAEVAHAQGMDLMTLSYAWLAGSPGVDSLIAGPATVGHLEAALAGASTSLSAQARAQVDALHGEFLGTDARYAR